jgi:hypothetical protein
MNGDCPSTGKQRFATARAAHQAVNRAYWARRTKKQPRRVYHCHDCQGYHLTSNGDLWVRRRRLASVRQGDEHIS